MAYNAQSLSRQSLGAASATGASGHSSHYYYRTADTIATVLATGYFNGAVTRLKKADTIEIVSSAGGTPVRTALIVTAVSATVVTVVPSGAYLPGGALKFVTGQFTTVTVADTVAISGLTTVTGILVSLDDDPVAGLMHVSATIGNQTGAPVAGSVVINGWKSTDATALLVAASTFGKKVSYIAWGT